jgi:hypothetical protein
VRSIKMLGLVACTACAAMALIGASSASALTVESCMTGPLPQECKAATTGASPAKFTANGTNVTLSNGFLTNTCKKSSVGGSVIDNSSASGSDMLEADITSASFTECNVAPVKVENLSWTLLTTSVLFLEAGMGILQENTGRSASNKVKVTLEVGGFIGNCTFEEDSTHHVEGFWTNAAMSRVELTGSLKKVAGSALCGSEGEITGVYEVATVTDPNLPNALNIQIL